jgi:hypothetical protein
MYIQNGGWKEGSRGRNVVIIMTVWRGLTICLYFILFFLRKKKLILPQVVINVELSGLVLAPRLKKGYRKIWEASFQPLGPMLQHLY